MINSIHHAILGQFEAALAMLSHCVDVCPVEHWEEKIANNTFRQVAYHALFFADYYLSPNEESFQLRALHERGGDERLPQVSAGLSQAETISYVAVCRQKAIDVLASETPVTLAGRSGFSARQISRVELHLYNIRHLQHHVGQLSAYLRRTDPSFAESVALRWIGSGWQ
jgi:DinB superfamily